MITSWEVFISALQVHHRNRTVYLEAVALTTVALPRRSQPPLPIAIRGAHENAHTPTAVGMPSLMRPTLRMHCPSALQRHHDH